MKSRNYVDKTEIQGKRAGEVLYWSLTADGVLVISGNGAMRDYDMTGEEANKAALWHKYSSQIRKMVITEGVTEIGASAFAGCTNLESVRLPKSIKRLSYGAFWGCGKLAEVVTAEPVRFVHVYEPLQEEEGTVSAIKMGLHVFSETPFAVGMWGDFYIRNGVLVDYFGTDAQVQIPDDVTEIGTMAFCGCKVKQVGIPNGLRKISRFAFAQTRLEKLVLPEGIKTVQYGAFSDIPGNLELTYSAGEEDGLNMDENAFLDTKIHLEGKKKLPAFYKLELKTEAGIRGYKKMAIKRDSIAVGTAEFNAGESIWRRVERGSHIICITSDPVEQMVVDVTFLTWNAEQGCLVRSYVEAFGRVENKKECVCVQGTKGWNMAKEEFLAWFRADEVKGLKEKGFIRNEPICGKEEWYWSSEDKNTVDATERLVNQWLKKHEGYQVKRMKHI